METKAIITVYLSSKKDHETIMLSNEEWDFLKTHIIEDTIRFQAACIDEFHESAIDMTDVEKKEPILKQNANIFKKLKTLGIDVSGLDT